MWCGSHTGVGWVGWTLMSVGMIAFWGVIAWAIVAVVRDASLRRNRALTPPDEVLANRLARGEISADEYQRTRDVLKSEQAQPEADKTVEAM